MWSLKRFQLPIIDFAYPDRERKRQHFIVCLPTDNKVRGKGSYFEENKFYPVDKYEFVSRVEFLHFLNSFTLAAPKNAMQTAINVMHHTIWQSFHSPPFYVTMLRPTHPFIH